MTQHSNSLIHSNSPYLLQHAHNPVNWQEWSPQALEQAQREDKPILVSIGYSACHWCHVMERESFENEEIAELMNQHYVCIKIDREERPDLDMIYMDAVQVMGINGGWPLNVFLTPEQKPFYGGTYFPPQQFSQILNGVALAFAEKRDQLEASADEFMQSLSRSELEKYHLEAKISPRSVEFLDQVVEHLQHRFDGVWGGTKKAPKFPMPSIWLFLARYAHLRNNDSATQHLNLTLHKMALGGLYDTLAGGFARYSVDGKWFAPHFEKMLYDNGQLLSLYAEAFALTGNPFYKEIIEQSYQWLQQEMLDPTGGIYSALDADSEGIEGKYYIWTAKELKELLGKDASTWMEYYTCTQEGNWEHHYNILFATLTPEEYASKNKLDPSEFKEFIIKGKQKLLQHRNSRIRPGLDDKILAGWNALTITGLCDAFAYIGESKYLDSAIQNAEFILNNMVSGNQLFRNYKNGKASFHAYLEDYAALIQALMALYNQTFNERYLVKARDFTEYTLQNFFDATDGLFYYNDAQGERLITRKKELFDNVIPASNSIMANNLFYLGTALDIPDYVQKSEHLLNTMQKMLVADPAYLCNWARLYAAMIHPIPEIIIIGSDAIRFARAINQHYIPHKVIMASVEPSPLGLLEKREAIQGKTTLYICYNKTCKLPVYSVDQALELLHGLNN